MGYCYCRKINRDYIPPFSAQKSEDQVLTEGCGPDPPPPPPHGGYTRVFDTDHGTKDSIGGGRSCALVMSPGSTLHSPRRRRALHAGVLPRDPQGHRCPLLPGPGGLPTRPEPRYRQDTRGDTLSDNPDRLFSSSLAFFFVRYFRTNQNLS